MSTHGLKALSWFCNVCSKISYQLNCKLCWCFKYSVWLYVSLLRQRTYTDYWKLPLISILRLLCAYFCDGNKSVVLLMMIMMVHWGRWKSGSGKCRSGKYRSDIVWKAIRIKYSKVRDEILANSWTSIAYNHRQCVRCQQSYRGLAIRRTKKHVNLTNNKRIKMFLQRFDSYMYAYTQFLFFYVQLDMPSAQRRC